MNNIDFEFIRTFIKTEAAIIFEPGKEYLIESRLMPIALEEGLSSLEALVKVMKSKLTPRLKYKVIDALTINETLFFRDSHPFEFLKKELLPALLSGKQKEKKLNIWCAASSSGQEPYSIAMILKELDESLNGWEINFIASDISEKMIERAKEGIYNQLEVNRGLPMPYLVKYFQKVGTNWQINKELREMVKFQKINLKNSWLLPPMDLIFMRNVLIYFNMDTKKEIFSRLEKTLAPNGYFFLGGSETTLGINNRFERLKINRVPCYQLKKA